jgi:hypothetical protein
MFISFDDGKIERLAAAWEELLPIEVNRIENLVFLEYL